MNDVVFLRDGKPIPVEQVVVESMRVTPTNVELTDREKWLMLKAFWAGALALKVAQDMNETMISLDDWLKADLTEKSTVEMALIQRAPPK